jgi:oxalate decarboxylase/phosphoglucose isomerase-like protein (cupin superfamily)
MKLKYKNTDIGGEVIKDNEVYVVKDNKTLNNLVVSSTDLYAKMKTTGHAHVGQEEVYNFITGSGKMEMIDTNGQTHNQTVKAGDVVLIPDGWFHRVHAGPTGCYFVCVFDGNRNH